ncbi:kelch domain-containing protein 3, partial [Actinomortierella wolfii]
MKSQNIIYLCWFLILGMTAFVTAQQNPAPMPASSASYVKYKNKFYVMGGTVMPEFKSTEGYSAQFFVLDLSKPWKSESPAWTPLPAGFRVSDVGAAMSQDGKIFITFPGFGQAAHRFFFENNTWSASQADLRDSMYSSCPVSLPNGTVFVVGGDERGDNVPVDIYSFNADQTVTTRYPKAALLNSTFEQYKAVWSEYLQSVVYYGGWDILADQSVRLYHPESKQWKKLKTTGGKNVTLVGHCIAITDDGRRILSYGGYDIANWGKFYFSDLEILDLETGNWTTGTSENIQRGYTACTVAGDYFLVWGGSVRFE